MFDSMHDHSNKNLVDKLNYFLLTKQIPNIIFHGVSGSGKRTIVNKLLLEIYGGDTSKLKSNVMMVNCSHGKGIKFIREELKFFAKTNMQSTHDIMFKSIVLLNADSLTIDAQSALRRCIESFSYNTRFFIVIENKQKLLNPILSRFCEIYVSEPISISEISGKREVKLVNLHKKNFDLNYDKSNTFFDSKSITTSNEEPNIIHQLEHESLKIIFENFQKNGKYDLSDIIVLSIKLYEDGIHVKQLIDNLETLSSTLPMGAPGHPKGEGEPEVLLSRCSGKSRSDLSRIASGEKTLTIH
jgi:hypothetical protein